MYIIHNLIVFINRYLPPTNHWLVLVSSVPVALACGTLFAFSVYSTQLAERCELTTSEAGNLNIAVVIGSAIGGLFGGLVTDFYGTQLPMLIGCITISLGYRWLYQLFINGGQTTMIQLVTTMLLIGIGSTCGYFSAIKAVTIEFPNYKGTAQSITIASFAIASLIYSYIATHIFNSNVEHFLKFLSDSCGIMIFMGFLFIRVDGHYKPRIEGETIEQETIEDNINEATALLPTPSHSDGKKTLKHLDLVSSLVHPIFWYHFSIFSIMQGLGQLVIFEIGFIVKAVYYYFPDDSSNLSLNQLQALHVSLIAICSFLGRLSSGPISDYLVNKLGYQRHWNLIIGLSIMLLGHFLNTLHLNWFITNLYSANIFLSIISCLIGYAYGFSFTCYPTIISDIFNMKNYSFIWGLMYSSTAFGVTLMTKIFGFFYDLNSGYNQNGDYICDKGSGCYNQSFEITSGLCVFVISLILGYIYYRK